MHGFLSQISGPWTLSVLWALSRSDAPRFSALKRLIPGISARMLTDRLRKLEANGLVERHYKPTIPPEVTYSLSEKGASLKPAMDVFSSIAGADGVHLVAGPVGRSAAAPSLREQQHVSMPAEGGGTGQLGPVVPLHNPGHQPSPYRAYRPPQMNREAVVETAAAEDSDAEAV
ncbi:transcriptional regulator [Roseibium hamelinense]|nr:transcriptional regulator [Roseibium hamelinense]